MKRLLLFALVAAAAWYGWKHQDQLHAHGTNELVAVNRTQRALERIRLNISGEEFAIEALEPGAKKVLPLKSEQDGEFVLYWNVRGVEGEKHWSGGSYNHGPVLIRHRLDFVDGDGVIWSSERIPGSTPAGH